MVENYDHCLNFEVIDKRITFVDADIAQVVANNYGCICIHIDFDSQWDGVIKTARFIHEEKFIDIVLSNNECICPREVAKKGRISFGVYGGDLKSSTPVAIEVEESILSLSGEQLPEEPTPDVYNQLMSKLSANQVEVDEATQACWDAVQAAEDATKALNKAKEDLEQGGFITGMAERNEGKIFGFWLGSEEEYENEANTIPANTLCLTVDDPFPGEFDQMKKDIADIKARPPYFEARGLRREFLDLSFVAQLGTMALIAYNFETSLNGERVMKECFFFNLVSMTADTMYEMIFCAYDPLNKITYRARLTDTTYSFEQIDEGGNATEKVFSEVYCIRIADEAAGPFNVYG